MCVYVYTYKICIAGSLYTLCVCVHTYLYIYLICIAGSHCCIAEIDRTL